MLNKSKSTMCNKIICDLQTCIDNDITLNV